MLFGETNMNIFKKLFTKQSTETEVVSKTVATSPETIEKALTRLKATEQDLKIFSLVEAKLLSEEYEVDKNVDGVCRLYTKRSSYEIVSVNSCHFKVKINSKWFRLCRRSEFYIWAYDDFYSILNRDIFSTEEVEQLICKYWFTFFDDQREKQDQVLRQKKKEEKERIKALQVEECIKTLEGK